MLESFLIGHFGLFKSLKELQGSSLSRIAFAPVGLDLNGLAGILQGTLVVALLGVSGGAVAVEDVVGGVKGNGLGVTAHGLLDLPSTQCLVALVFQLCYLGRGGKDRVRCDQAQRATGVQASVSKAWGGGCAMLNKRSKKLQTG